MFSFYQAGGHNFSYISQGVIYLSGLRIKGSNLRDLSPADGRGIEFLSPLLNGRGTLQSPCTYFGVLHNRGDHD